MILMNGTEVHQWNRAVLFQDMRMSHEGEHVTLDTIQGNVEVFDGDWVATDIDGRRSVIRKGTGEAMGWGRVR